MEAQADTERLQREQQERLQQVQRQVESMRTQGAPVTPELQRGLEAYVQTGKYDDKTAQTLFGEDAETELARQRVDLARQAEQRRQQEMIMQASENVVSQRGYTGRDADAARVIMRADVPAENVAQLVLPAVSSINPASGQPWSDAQIRAGTRTLEILRNEMGNLPLSRLRQLEESLGDDPVLGGSIERRVRQIEGVAQDVQAIADEAQRMFAEIEKQTGEAPTEERKRVILEDMLTQLAASWNMTPQELEHLLTLAR